MYICNFVAILISVATFGIENVKQAVRMLWKHEPKYNTLVKHEQDKAKQWFEDFISRKFTDTK